MSEKNHEKNNESLPELIEKPSEIPFSEATVSERYDDVFWGICPDLLEFFEKTADGLLISAQNGAMVSIQFLRETMVRVRFAPEGIFEDDFSWAVDPKFRPEKVDFSVEESENGLEIEVGDLGLHVAREGLKIRFFDLMSGITICEDSEPMWAKRTILNGICEVRATKKTWRREAFFGLGDKTCGTNLRGKKYHNWCSDSFAFGAETDENYRAIPFYLAQNQGFTYGIFLDNTFRSKFDFDSDSNAKTIFGAEGGELNYYFFWEKNPTEVAAKYTELTGRPELPPIWALGFHQSRWSYIPEKNVLELVEKFEENELPLDAVYLDIDYMIGWRCFTVNKDFFPDLKKLSADLGKKGVRLVAMIDPGIKADKDYFLYKNGLEKGHFLKKSDGQIALAPVWPGLCAFPDFTNSATRKWFGEQYQRLTDLGISGFWNDMNEPAVFHINKKTLPDDVLHGCDGFPTNHRRAHNIYGMQMTRASIEGLRKIEPEKRPFLLGRASFSGGQRFSALWTGDNVADWDHLQLANIQVVRLAVSGFSFSGTDIGGFVGTPDAELMVRWLQLSAFHPFMRVHYSGEHVLGDAAETTEIASEDSVKFTHEPFSFGEKTTSLAKKAIELRYHLLPTIYSAFKKYVTDGTPMLRHVFFEDPTDQKLVENEREFMFGEHILVSPVVKPKLQRQSIYLPKTSNWFYFWTGQPAAGGVEFFAALQPEQIPFFVREGAVLVVGPPRKNTAEAIEEITFYVYFKKGKEITHYYEDAGEGYGYLDGQFLEHTLTVEGAENSLALTRECEGKFVPPYQKIIIYLVGLPFFIKKCRADKSELPIKEIRMRDRSIYKLEVEPNFEKIEIS